jgi:hypothetical protein
LTLLIAAFLCTLPQHPRRAQRRVAGATTDPAGGQLVGQDVEHRSTHGRAVHRSSTTAAFAGCIRTGGYESRSVNITASRLSYRRRQPAFYYDDESDGVNHATREGVRFIDSGRGDLAPTGSKVVPGSSIWRRRHMLIVDRATGISSFSISIGMAVSGPLAPARSSI